LIYERSSGVLLHPTSLPSRFGIGELGEELKKFISLLELSEQNLWQVLPLSPTGYGDSPYQPLSSFAGNPLMISIEGLFESGLLTEDEIHPIPDFPKEYVDYGWVIQYKSRLFKYAYKRFVQNIPADFSEFCKDNDWLEEFATYMALKEAHDLKPWIEWEVPYRNPANTEVELWKKENREAINYIKFLQYIFNMQWKEIKNFANMRGIKVIGDLPIYVAYDSAETWANQELFVLDSEGVPEVVAGVPPDYFSSTGQLWGNPIYRWDVLKQNNYRFWIDRIRRSLELVDYLRIDHFIGFVRFWQVKFGEATAVNGKWVKGPGMKLFNTIKKELGNIPLIAEDLGLVTQEVIDLRKEFGLPGMKILQHGFSHNADSSNMHLPHNYEKDFVVYTGTHDNETVIQWFTNTDKEVREHFVKYTNSTQIDFVGDMIRLAMQSVAVFTIFPLQDILRLPKNARMNLPGTASGNWKWRVTEIKMKYFDQLKELSILYSRV